MLLLDINFLIVLIFVFKSTLKSIWSPLSQGFGSGFWNCNINDQTGKKKNHHPVTWFVQLERWRVSCPPNVLPAMSIIPVVHWELFKTRQTKAVYPDRQPSYGCVCMCMYPSYRWVILTWDIEELSRDSSFYDCFQLTWSLLIGFVAFFLFLFFRCHNSITYLKFWAPQAIEECTWKDVSILYHQSRNH